MLHEPTPWNGPVNMAEEMEDKQQGYERKEGGERNLFRTGDGPGNGFGVKGEKINNKIKKEGQKKNKSGTKIKLIHKTKPGMNPGFKC